MSEPDRAALDASIHALKVILNRKGTTQQFRHCLSGTIQGMAERLAYWQDKIKHPVA